MLCHGLNQFNSTFAGALCRFASAALSLPLWRCARVQPASSIFEHLQYVKNGGNGDWDLPPCFVHLSLQEIPFALASAAADAPPGRDADAHQETVETVTVTQC